MFRYASKSKSGNTEPQTVIHISCNLEPVDFQLDTATDSKVWDVPKTRTYTSPVMQHINPILKHYNIPFTL